MVEASFVKGGAVNDSMTMKEDKWSDCGSHWRAIALFAALVERSLYSLPIKTNPKKG
jgi:hypothetical protein